MLNSDAKAEAFDHVKIAVREKPLAEAERAAVQVMLRSDEDKLVAFYPDSKEGLVYNYDYFFPEEATQIDVFQTIGMEMVDLVLGGYSSCCIATGPSATGKTHCLFGSNQEPGLIQLATKELFHRIESQDEVQYTVKMAYWEMACDVICDALGGDAPATGFYLHKSEQFGGTMVSGLKVVEVGSWEELDERLMQGNIRRIQLSEQRNSRWHGFIRLFLEAIPRADPVSRTSCMMTFVHTKGPDRVGQKGARGDIMKNGSTINKSVSLFGSAVLHAVDFRRKAMKEAKGPEDHAKIIERSTSFFMESKFTQLLSNAVCGAQGTFLLATVCTLDYHETTDTLEALQNAQQMTAQLAKRVALTEHGKVKKQLAAVEAKVPKSELAEGHPLTEIEERVAKLKAKLGGDLPLEDEKPKPAPVPPAEFSAKQYPQQWKQNVLKSKMHGDRATVYIPAAGGAPDDKKKNTYRGQWAHGKREGFGEHITPLQKYEGHWKDGMRDGEGTAWTRATEKDPWVRVYKGGWKQDLKHGEGVQWSPNGDVYQGYFEAGKRSALGKLFLANGDRIEGQFRDDHVSGWATLFCKNGDWFEGHWAKSQREGPGVWYYTQKQQCYRGEWHNNTPKFGVIEDMEDKETDAPSRYLPRCGLKDPDAVLAKEQRALDEKRQRAAAALGEVWELAPEDDVSWHADGAAHEDL